ncbi:hypothetical protein LTR05_002738 [Lithohypha guttulata]|uniref:Uncharacterized protein n=1 Tax=Lithohypha guttulata TaxID=1690604 RepID=A0AAN7T4T3_9EURO|nr:hypothetical protein LTR05_002738 [Lithohypha guttulata]
MPAMSSRTNSWSSVSSTSSSVSPATTSYVCYDLEFRATQILTSLAQNPSDLSTLDLISPNIKVEHGDQAPVYSIERYISRFTIAGAQHPDLKLEIKEACVDEIQRKVWVRSEISGLPDDVVKERIDMLSFDNHGILVGSIDHQKVKRRW